LVSISITLNSGIEIRIKNKEGRKKRCYFGNLGSFVLSIFCIMQKIAFYIKNGVKKGLYFICREK
jgi:hypothetical protein